MALALLSLDASTSAGVTGGAAGAEARRREVHYTFRTHAPGAGGTRRASTGAGAELALELQLRHSFSLVIVALYAIAATAS